MASWSDCADAFPTSTCTDRTHSTPALPHRCVFLPLQCTNPPPIHLTFRLSIFQSVTSHTAATRPAPHRVCLSHELFLCHSNKTRLESRGSACMASRLHTEALEQIVREQLAFVFELGQFHLLLSAVWSRCGNQTTCCHAAVLSMFAVAGICGDFAHISATLTVSAFSSVSDPLITMQTTY